MTDWLLLNGKLQAADQACVLAGDRGFSLGHGLFETMHAYDGLLPFLNWHWQRLTKSAVLLSIAYQQTLSELQADIEQLLAACGLNHGEAIVRMTVTQGVASRGILPESDLSPTCVIQAFPQHQRTWNAMTAAIVPIRRMSDSLSNQVKSTSYLDNILARQAVYDVGADEAILLNEKGELAEGATSNIFILENQQLITPPCSAGALPGITRRFLLEACQSILPIKIDTITHKRLMTSEMVLFTNSVWGIRAASRIDQTEFSNKQMLLSDLLSYYSKYVLKKM